MSSSEFSKSPLNSFARRVARSFFSLLALARASFRSSSIVSTHVNVRFFNLSGSIWRGRLNMEVVVLRRDVTISALRSPSSDLHSNVCASIGSCEPSSAFKRSG